MYYHIGQAWQNLDRETIQKRLIDWRSGNAVVKLEKPTRLDRARALGYKAKRGIVVVRVKLKRGGRQRPRHTHGRKSRKQHVRKILKMSYQWVAELRASQKYDNLEVLNSYYIGQDGKYYFYEVILLDPEMPEIKSDKNYSWVYKGTHKGRVERGMTSAAKKSRGLSTKSRNMKVRPSQRAWNRQGK